MIAPPLDEAGLFSCRLASSGYAQRRSRHFTNQEKGALMVCPFLRATRNEPFIELPFPTRRPNPSILNGEIDWCYLCYATRNSKNCPGAWELSIVSPEPRERTKSRCSPKQLEELPEYIKSDTRPTKRWRKQNSRYSRPNNRERDPHGLPLSLKLLASNNSASSQPHNGEMDWSRPLFLSTKLEGMSWFQ
jgi:hypothetical protein